MYYLAWLTIPSNSYPYPFPNLAPLCCGAQSHGMIQYFHSSGSVLTANPHGHHKRCSSLWGKGHPLPWLQGNSVSVNSVILRLSLALPSLCKMLLRESTVMMAFPPSRRTRDRRGPSSPMWLLPQSVQQSQLFFFFLIRFEKKPAVFVWSGGSMADLDEEYRPNLLHFAPWLPRVLSCAPDFEEPQMFTYWHIILIIAVICCISNSVWRTTRAKLLLPRHVASGKQSVSIWRFWKVLCPSSFIFVSF